MRNIKYFGLNELRTKFLEFFKSKEHLIMESFPLVPINDKSILLISAGMAPFKPYFSGEQTPPKSRIAACQKCVRVNDIENVGRTSRHCTFFEMLGNFSFGDYFKSETLAWMWEFLTQVLEIPEDLLFPSVYLDDDEAFDVWTKELGLPPEKISRLGKEHNFWEIEGGAGPCGPCSEIYFDRGKEHGCADPACAPGCDCDRFIEVCNNVFTQFDSDGKGNYTPLAQKNIDMGMGLERIAMVVQQVNAVAEVDTVKAVIEKMCEIAGIKYNASEKSDISVRIIADHIRSAVFMIGDNIMPSNEGRGYVLRRILRRAARHGKLLSVKGAFLYDLADTVIDLSKEAYPELEQKRDYIKRVLKGEEDRFEATIDAGLERLGEMIAKAKAENLTVLPGADIFRLYDTFGFPYDLTLEISAEHGLELDKDGAEGFDALMREQVKRAREARSSVEGWGKDKLAGLAKIDTQFTGYSGLTGEAQVLAVIIENGDELTEIENINEGEFILILDKTPFYAESGGQIGDTGIITTASNAEIEVLDCKKTADGTIIHVCRIESGELKAGDKVQTRVYAAIRRAIMRNHTAAHLLHAALRNELGGHVEQSGSYVDAERVRFDFTHFAALTEDELRQVELMVNDMILSGLDISAVETDMESAKKMGASALFGEKYGDTVRVVKMGDFSCELCGGIHLDNTGKAGLFKIISESSIAAGIRRIEGTTGYGVIGIIEKDKGLINSTAKILKANNPGEIDKKGESLQSELKEARREIDKLNAQIAAQKVQDLRAKIIKIDNISYVSAKFDDIGAEGAKILCEELRAQDPHIVAVIAAVNRPENKLTFTAVCGAEAVKAGADAGALIKRVAQAAGGGGGGKPEFAVAGGRDLDKLGEALASGEQIVKSMLSK